MAEATTATDTPLDKVKVLISQFEDDHHHPRSGRLWWVLLFFTLLEIGWASSLLGLTDRELEADQFANAQSLCQNVLKEKEADAKAQAKRDTIADAQYARQDYLIRVLDKMPALNTYLDAETAKLAKDVREGKERATQVGELQAGVLKALGNSKATLSAELVDQEIAGINKLDTMPSTKIPLVEPHLLAYTGRPGHRIYTLMTDKERELVKEFAAGNAGEEKHKELAAAFNLVLNKEEFYLDKDFAALDVSPAVSAKLAGLRTSGGATKSFFAFMGEADVVMLNRGLLEKAYPTQIKAAPIPFFLIFGLLGCAIVKMLLVAEFFMHVKYEGVWIRILMIPTAVLAFVVIAFLAPDVGRVHMTSWSYKFLAPMFLLILAGIFVVRFLTKYVDIPKDEAEPAHH